MSLISSSQVGMWRPTDDVCILFLRCHFTTQYINRNSLTCHGCLKRLFTEFFNKNVIYFTSQEVGNPVQEIKCVELSRFQPILKLSVTFVESLFTLMPYKPAYRWFVLIQICDQNEGAIHNFKSLIMLEYRLCCLVCAENDK